MYHSITKIYLVMELHHRLTWTQVSRGLQSSTVTSCFSRPGLPAEWPYSRRHRYRGGPPQHMISRIQGSSAAAMDNEIFIVFVCIVWWLYWICAEKIITLWAYYKQLVPRKGNIKNSYKHLYIGYTLKYEYIITYCNFLI